MNLQDLGRRIRKLRETLGLTQSQVAHSVMVTAQAVSKWERGENAPDLSLLSHLACLFGVSIDFLLMGEDRRLDTFEATVFCTSLRDFQVTTARLTPKEVSCFVNGIFQSLTDIVLSFGGVPVKYVGDGFLAFFTGVDDIDRAIESAVSCFKSLSKESLLITLDRGDIFCGAIGHSDYSSMDVLGEPVNRVFLLNQWATDRSSESFVVTQAIASTVLKNILSFSSLEASFLDETVYFGVLS